MPSKRYVLGTKKDETNHEVILYAEVYAATVVPGDKGSVRVWTEMPALARHQMSVRQELWLQRDDWQLVMDLLGRLSDEDFARLEERRKRKE